MTGTGIIVNDQAPITNTHRSSKTQMKTGYLGHIAPPTTGVAIVSGPLANCP
jgi:hypothetical protein